MPLDERLNPASAATEKQIVDLEKAVRKLIYGGAKTARLDMIIQNLASRFSLYNNLWLKKLNELESGVTTIQKKKSFQPPPPPRKEKEQREIYLTLNDETTFERLVAAYRELLPDSPNAEKERNKIIETMKTKMLTHNLVEARVTFTVQKGKLSIRIKK
jgi:hypothetical protein